MGRRARTSGIGPRVPQCICTAHTRVCHFPPLLHVLGTHSLFSVSYCTYCRLQHEQGRARAARDKGEHLRWRTNHAGALGGHLIALLVDGGLARDMLACRMAAVGLLLGYTADWALVRQLWAWRSGEPVLARPAGWDGRVGSRLRPQKARVGRSRQRAR